MTQDARLTLPESVGAINVTSSGEFRTKILMPVAIIAVAAVVVLSMITESHRTVEQRLELFQSSSVLP